MKKLLLIPLLFLAYASFAQLPVVRGPDGVTVEDYRAYFLKNFRLPVFSDTTAANVSKGLDSVGTMISIRGTDTVYIRAQSTGAFHKWTPISGTGGGGGGTDTIFVTPIGTAAGMIQTLYAVDGNLRVSNWGPGYGTLPFLAGDSLAYIDIDTNNIAYKTWVINQFGPGGAQADSAFNGITQTGRYIQLGDTITKSDTITSTNAAFNIRISGINTNVNQPLLAVQSTGNSGIVIQGASTATTGGTGVKGIVTTAGGIGVYGTVSNGLTGVYAQSTGTAVGLKAESISGAAATFTTTPSSTNDIDTLLILTRNSSVTGAAGIGGAIQMLNINAGGVLTLSNSLISKLTVATAGASTSQFDITGLNAGTIETYANFQTGGIVRVNNLADTLATKAYARSVGGGGGGSSTAYIGFDTVQTYTSGTTLTQGTSTNYIQVDPASVQATLTITTLASGGTWHTSNDLYIVFGGTVTSGNPVITTFALTAGSGLTIVESMAFSGGINAGDVAHYHKIGTILYRVP